MLSNLFPIVQFQEMVKKIGEEFIPGIQCTQTAFNILNAAMEDNMVKRATAAVCIAATAKKSGLVTVQDFMLVRSVLKITGSK